MICSQQYPQQETAKSLVDMREAGILSPSRLPISPSERRAFPFIIPTKGAEPGRTVQTPACNNLCNSLQQFLQQSFRPRWKDSADWPSGLLPSLFRRLALAGGGQEWQ